MKRDLRELQRNSCNYPYSRNFSYFAAAAAAFLCTAQRRFTASAMRFRPSGDRFRLFFFAAGALAPANTARPMQLSYLAIDACKNL